VREIGILVGQLLLLVSAVMILMQLREWWKSRRH